MADAVELFHLKRSELWFKDTKASADTAFLTWRVAEQNLLLSDLYID
jgi:hypothetical protein